MPTLNAYANDPGYFIRAWTPELSNINYKLKPSGWMIVDDWEGLSDGDEITWQQINVLKSVGVVYTEDTGVIYPDDEEFQPDPEQVGSVDLSEDDARAFIETILSHCDLSQEQVAELYQMLDVDPPVGETSSKYSNVSHFVESELRDEVASGSLPISETIPTSTGGLTSNTEHSKGGLDIKTFVVEPSWEPPESSKVEMDEIKHTLAILLSEPGSDPPESIEFVLHQIFFNEDNIVAWTGNTSKQASWTVRSELFSQISTILPPVIVSLDRAGVGVSGDPTDFDIEFYHNVAELKQS